MKIVRFASASDGGSQFVEVDLPIDNASTDAFGNTVHRSAILPAQSTMVTEMPEGLYQDWHPASRRQLLVVLSGTLEVETSDGRKHRCGSGDVFLAADLVSQERFAAATPVLFPVAGFDFKCTGKNEEKLPPGGRVPVLIEALGHLGYHRTLRRQYRGAVDGIAESVS